MERRRLLVDRPFFSVCIPQYNRTSFLIEACRSLAFQAFNSFEVCISDDCSTDGREEELLRFLESTPLSFVYRRRQRNGRYDANLRDSIGMALGRWCFLLGNDDALASPATLQEIFDEIQRFRSARVVVTNYVSAASARLFRRVRKTGIAGSGPDVAAARFRNFSFVGGILLERNGAQAHATDRWDGSEMYQMFLGCRIIAEGGNLLEVDRVAVRQGIQVPGERVDSYASRPKAANGPVVERRLPLNVMGRLVVDAVALALPPPRTRKVAEKVFLQILTFTYFFWIVEYKRVQSWKYALGVCLGMRPGNILRGVDMSRLGRLRVRAVYGVVTCLGLLIPVGLFHRLYPALYSLAKRAPRET